MRMTRKKTEDQVHTPLTGAACACRACGERFNSVAGFDMHRVGVHGVDRRCLTPEEMRGRGMSEGARGWVTAAMPAMWPVNGAARDLKRSQ